MRIIKDQTAHTLPGMGEVMFGEPRDMYMGRKAWVTGFDYVSPEGKAYHGDVFADGSAYIYHKGRALPEAHKKAWREALAIAAKGIIREARRAALGGQDQERAQRAVTESDPVAALMAEEARQAALDTLPPLWDESVSNDALQPSMAGQDQAGELPPVYDTPAPMDIASAYEAGAQWAGNLKAGDTFLGTSQEPWARKMSSRFHVAFIAGASANMPRLWDETGREIIGVGLIDTLATLSKVER